MRYPDRSGNFLAASENGRFMKRRYLLRALASLPLLPGFETAIRPTKAATVRTWPPRQRVRPSDPDWPTAVSWAQLKKDVGGNLIEPKSLFGSCASRPSGA